MRDKDHETAKILFLWEKTKVTKNSIVSTRKTD